MYSEELEIAVRNYFETEDWDFDFDEEHGVFHARISLKSKLKELELYIFVYEDHIMVSGVIPLSADKESLPRVAEFLMRENFSLIFGSYALDFDDGEISFRVSIDCRDGIVPDYEWLDDIICLPAVMFDNDADALLRVLLGIATPEEAAKGLEMQDEPEECDDDSKNQIKEL